MRLTLPPHLLASNCVCVARRRPQHPVAHRRRCTRYLTDDRAPHLAPAWPTADGPIMHPVVRIRKEKRQFVRIGNNPNGCLTRSQR